MSYALRVVTTLDARPATANSERPVFILTKSFVIPSTVPHRKSQTEEDRFTYPAWHGNIVEDLLLVGIVRVVLTYILVLKHDLLLFWRIRARRALYKSAKSWDRLSGSKFLLTKGVTRCKKVLLNPS